MEAPRSEIFPPPPGVIPSLKAGFDAIAVHLTAILLPLALDLLLWLGPRLGVKEYYQDILPGLVKDWKTLGFSAAQIQTAVDSYKTQVANLDALNLLALLRTFPVGISSLLSGSPPALTPFGQPQVVQIAPLGNIFALVLLITLTGWLGGALYFRWVASLVVTEEMVIEGRAIWRSVGFSFLATVLLILIGVPVFIIVYLLNLLSPLLGQIVLLLAGFISLWLIVPFFFAGHGIFMRRQTVFASILSGIRMARFSLPNSSLFVLSVILTSVGLNYLWSIPDPDSWMLLIGLVGHAFITTSLLAASFIYYRDTTNWLQAIFDRLRAGAASGEAS